MNNNKKHKKKKQNSYSLATEFKTLLLEIITPFALTNCLCQIHKDVFRISEVENQNQKCVIMLAQFCKMSASLGSFFFNKLAYYTSVS